MLALCGPQVKGEPLVIRTHHERRVWGGGWAWCWPSEGLVSQRSVTWAGEAVAVRLVTSEL